jgi:hypothetical protein
MFHKARLQVNLIKIKKDLNLGREEENRMNHQLQITWEVSECLQLREIRAFLSTMVSLLQIRLIQKVLY